jgi:hypothetical protein
VRRGKLWRRMCEPFRERKVLIMAGTVRHTPL